MGKPESRLQRRRVEAHASEGDAIMGHVMTRLLESAMRYRAA